MRVTYRGDLTHAYALVECLETEGAEVIWTPPDEHGNRSMGRHEVIIDMDVYASEQTDQSASLAVARAARDSFRKRFPAKGSVEIADDGR